HGDRWQWHAMDVSMWQGHRAYIEILDDGPGQVAVDAILFANGGPPPEGPNPLLLRALDGDKENAAQAQARRVPELFRKSVEQGRSGKVAERADVRDRVAILNWMLTEAAPPADKETSPETAKLAALAKRLRDRESRLPDQRRALAMADGTAVNERVFIR